MLVADFRSYLDAQAAVEPKYLFIAPARAIPRLLEKVGWSLAQVDLIEINEAFAAQVIGCNRELKVPLDKLNAVGSGISLGHPVGATGARIMITMINELKRRGKKFGCASLCASGGPAHAFIVEVL